MMTHFFLGRDAFINYSIFVTGIILVVPALFWLFFGREMKPASETDVTAGRLFWLTVIPLGLLIAPGTSFIIQKSIGSVPFEETMIAVPTALLTAYAFLHAADHFQLAGKKRYAAVLCLIILILANASIPIRHHRTLGFELVANPMKISPEVQNISEIAGDDYVLLPKEILGQTGEYDSGIHAVPLSEITYDETEPRDVVKAGVKADASLIVIKKAYDDAGIFKENQYIQDAETDHYIIYRHED